MAEKVSDGASPPPELGNNFGIDDHQVMLAMATTVNVHN